MGLTVTADEILVESIAARLQCLPLEIDDTVDHLNLVKMMGLRYERFSVITMSYTGKWLESGQKPLIRISL